MHRPPNLLTDPAVENLLRSLAPQVLGALVRRHGQFASCEDAVQEALLAASVEWPTSGVPENPRAWLSTVASRRLVDEWRSEGARQRRESATIPNDFELPVASSSDDSLALLFLCCHPSLSVTSQLALTLRAVGGLRTSEIARAFLVPEATMAQRISRAKQTIKSSNVGFALPLDDERAERMCSVQHVLYLIFNEGYTTSAGATLQRTDLTTEAVRLARLLNELVPDDGEARGLLALMLLTDARRLARVGVDGSLIPMAEQDRSLWDAQQIAEGVSLITTTLGKHPIGPYQLQAAIAAVHDEAESAEATDWAQIVVLYELLETVAPSPVVTLNKAVAVAMVNGPQTGLALIGTLSEEQRSMLGHRIEAVRAHLLEEAGELLAARDAYRRAGEMTASLPEQRYLALRAARLNG